MPAQFRNVLGAKTYVVEEGEGHPILFLHGNPDTSDLWLHHIAELKKEYRCIAVDTPGFGRSEIPFRYDFTKEAMLAFLDDLLWELEIKTKISIIVHDLGGFYGLSYLVKYPEKVSHIGIFDTLFFTSYKWHFWANIWRAETIGELSMEIMNFPLFFLEMKRGSRKLSYEEIKKMYAYDSKNMRQSILKTYREFSPEKFEGIEDKMRSTVQSIPNFVAWGKHDPYIPLEFAYQFGTENVHILDCGHWTPAEEKEKSVELIQNLMRNK